MPGPSHFARRTARFTVVFSLAVVACLVSGVVAQGAPPNDDLANAVVLSGASGSSTGTDVDATFELNESSALTAFGTGGDVWYTWTAPSSGFVAFRTTDPGTNPNLDTVLAAHTGSDITALTTVELNDDYPVCCMSRIIFEATLGEVYAIGVGPFSLDPVTQGEFGLEWDMGASDFFDEDVPQVSVQSVTRLKHAFSLSFIVGDETGDIVGGDWVTTECQLDGGSFTPCTSPWSVSGLPGGKHQFTIRATDEAGNVGTLSGTVRVKGSPHFP
jgi:hypothetical protein